MCTLTVLMKDQFTFVQFCYFAARCFYEQYPVLWSQWLPPLPTVASGLFFKKAFLIESQIVVAILFFICKFLKLFIVSLPCSLDLTWRRTYPGVAWCTSLFKKEIRHCFFTVFFTFSHCFFTVVIITSCNHGLSVTSLAFLCPLPPALMKTYRRLSWLKHRCCFQTFTTVQQTLLKSIFKKCLSLCWICEINVFHEIHLWKQTVAIGMLKVVDITTWNLTYLA